MCFPEIAKYAGKANHTDIPYCLLGISVELVYLYKPLALSRTIGIGME